MTMDDFELLALANGAAVSMHRPTDCTETIDSFRSLIMSAMRGTHVHIVVSFSRCPRPDHNEILFGIETRCSEYRHLWC